MSHENPEFIYSKSLKTFQEPIGNQVQLNWKALKVEIKVFYDNRKSNAKSDIGVEYETYGCNYSQEMFLIYRYTLRRGLKLEEASSSSVCVHFLHHTHRNSTRSLSLGVTREPGQGYD